MPNSFSARAKDKLENAHLVSKYEQVLDSKLRPIADESALVLKGHLYIEQVCQEILAEFFTNASSSTIIEDFQSFATTVTLLRASNLIDDPLYTTLLTVNKVRNRFAHDVAINTIKDALKFGTYNNDFKTACSTMRVSNRNKQSVRDNFIGMCCKVYAELQKCRFIAMSMRRYLLRDTFIDELEFFDLSNPDPTKAFHK